MRVKLGPVAVGVLVASVALGSVSAPAWSRSHSDSRDAAGRLDLRKASVTQVRRSLRLAIRTSGGFRLSALDRHPGTTKADSRFICLHIHLYGHAFTRQLCVGQGPNGDDDTLGYAQLEPDGSVRSWHAIDARVARPDRRSVVARFNPRRAGMHPGKYRWRVISQSTGARCRTSPRACFDRVPDRHEATLKLQRTQPIGCRDSGGTPRFGGPTSRKRIALTFDDGPSAYTPKILSILRHQHAKATFFEIGQQVSSQSRAVLQAGNELANHSYHHENYPSRGSMGATNNAIRSVTGFEPCLFRPPGGSYSSRVVGDARALGMTTVIWNVDPRDWSAPGSGAIYSRVVGAARPGAIVVMHDGGGNRSQTVAALPSIIRTLHARGYRLVTVSKLLHQRTIWGAVRKPLRTTPLIPYDFLNSPAGAKPPTSKPE